MMELGRHSCSPTEQTQRKRACSLITCHRFTMLGHRVFFGAPVQAQLKWRGKFLWLSKSPSLQSKSAHRSIPRHASPIHCLCRDLPEHRGELGDSNMLPGKASQLPRGRTAAPRICHISDFLKGSEQKTEKVHESLEDTTLPKITQSWGASRDCQPKFVPSQSG